MKKSYAYVIAIVIAIVLLAIITNFDVLYLLSTQNSWIKIIFFILTLPVIAFLLIPVIKKKKLQLLFNENIKSLSKTEDFNTMFGNIKKNTENDFKILKNNLVKLLGIFVGINIVLILVAMYVQIPQAITEMTSSFYKLVMVLVKILVIAATWLMFGFIFKNKLKEYQMMYKTKVISVMVKWLRNDLEYEHKNDEKEKIFRSQYKNSSFEVRKFNVFSAEDYIYGNLSEGVNIRFAEICTKLVENQGTENETTRVLFNGLFGATALNVNMTSTIKLLTDDLKVVLDDSFIKMDSTELEKNFDVYCSDRVLAMRVFTAKTMEMLNEFYEKYKIAFEMIIENNIIYLRFHTDNMFETNIFSNPLNKDKLFLYYSVLKFVFEITENINNALNDMSM